MSPDPIVVRAYRALVRLMPTAVRKRHGDEMTRTFAAMWERACESGGRVRIVLVAFGRIPLVTLAEWSDELGFPIRPEAILRTTRQAVRGLGRAPAFSISAVLLLGLGVGAVTTIFTLVDHILLRPLPYPDAERLFVVENGSHSGQDWRSFQTMPSVERWVATSGDEVTLTGEGEPVRLEEARVTREFFGVFGARPAVGRLFVDDDFVAADAVVLTFATWERLFGRDPGVVGRTLRIDDAPALVVGVADESFIPPMRARWSAPDLWRPQNFADPMFGEMGYHTLSVVGVLRPGATLADAGAEAHAIAEERARAYPDFYTFDGGKTRDLPLVSLQEATVGDVRAGLGLLLGAVVMLLLVACANVAHLFMARGVGRAREMAVRRALGAGTRALSGQLLAESLVVALAGTAIGAALARLGLSAFLALAPEALPRAEEVRLDARVLAFALATAALTALAFGMIPGLRVARRDPGDALRAGGRTASGDRAARALRGGLVVAEVALSLVLVTGAGLLLRSFQRLHDQPLGFRIDGVWTLPLRVAEPARDPEQAPVLRARMEAIQDALAAVPGVRSATYGMTVPVEYTGGNTCCWRIDGGPPGNEKAQRVNMHPVGTEYAAVFAPRVLAGRWWSSDEAELEPVPATLNEPLAIALYGSAADAVGKTIVLHGQEHRVTGVIAADRHYGPDRDARPSAYVPWSSVPFPVPQAHMAVLVESVGDDLARQLSRAVWSVEPNVPVPTVRSMSSWVELATAGTRFESALFTAFGAVALLLAAGGLYGTMSYTVGLERRELGIRLALGARRRAIEARVVRRGLALAAAGAALGLAGAWGSGRLLEARLFGVEPRDPTTLASAAAVLLATAAVACWLPARRAAATDPLETLREE
jgi:predicted permease